MSGTPGPGGPAGPEGPGGPGSPGGPGGPQAPSEDELRAAYEAELSRVAVVDVIAQTTVTLLNLAARQLAPSSPQELPEGAAAPSETALEQASDAIDGARALLGILERRIPQEVRPLRDGLAQLQMAYAAAVQASGATGAGAGAGAPAPGTAGRPEGESAGSSGAPAGSDGEQGGPGPAEASGRLWVPGR